MPSLIVKLALYFIALETVSSFHLDSQKNRSRPIQAFGGVPSQALHRPRRLTQSLLAQQRRTKPRNATRLQNSLANYSVRSKVQNRDAVIVGGGLAGLTAALYLSQIDPDRHITILDREDPLTRDKKTSTVASFAAAGMLAPQSERLPKGPYLNLCMESRGMYPDFCSLVESLAKDSDSEGQKFLADDSGEMDPWSVGYVASGGFFAPAFAGDAVATWAPPDDTGTATWLDSTQARELEPNLHPDVVGGWWFPEDASVDAVRLSGSLRAACVAAGVQILTGLDYDVASLDLADGVCKGLWLKSGLYIKGKSILIANGAWIRSLLPVPIEPHKGQSLSLRMPKDQPPLLSRVLFAQDSYIVPKADGRIVIGATVEAGSYDPHITPAGMLHVLSHAIQLMPVLKDLPIEDTWAGLRPTTPDKGPIIGETPWKNLFIAGGYWRNGVLLAPKTGELMAKLMSGKVPLEDADREYLTAFSWDRFISEKGGNALAANSRYAASMHPIHSRKSGVGVAASVGTELGFYSSAQSAKEERLADRQALMSDDGSEESFERAAEMGKRDASAFSFGTDAMGTNGDADRGTPQANHSQDDIMMSSFEGSVDAFTIGSASTDPDVKDIYHLVEGNKAASTDPDVKDIYELVKENKAQQGMTLDSSDVKDEGDARPDPGFRVYHVDSETGEETEVPPYTNPDEFLKEKATGNAPNEKCVADDDPSTSATGYDLLATYEKIKGNKARNTERLEYEKDERDERPDPGFRIYHVDSLTGEHREVPPYTRPEDFLASLPQQNQEPQSRSNNVGAPVKGEGTANDEYNETTFDGYTDITAANSRENRQDELEAMKAARRRNRLGVSHVEEDKIGARRME